MTPPDRAGRWAALVLVLYTVIAGVVLLVPRPIEAGFTPWFRGQLALLQGGGLRTWIDYDFVEYASHAVLFIPLGILAVVAVGRRLAWLAVLGTLGLGVLVEFGPSLMGVEHPASTLDLVLNCAGAVVGTAIGYAVLLGLRRTPSHQPPSTQRPGGAQTV